MTRTATSGRRGWPATVVLVWAALLAGCSAAPPSAPEAAAAAPPSTHADAMPGGALSNTAGESPADVALQLEALLGQHSVLVADMMRSRIRGDDDFAQAASAAVTRNTDDLTAVVKAMFGEQAATAFHGTWTDHTTAFYNYARSLATGDTAARDDARAQLVKFETGLGDFFSAASQGRLPQDAARSTLTTHVDHLLRQADAYAAHDYGRAADLYRTAYSHAFAIGQALGHHAAATRPGGAAQPAVVAAAVGAGPAARRAHRARRRHAARRCDREPRLPGGGGGSQQEHRRAHGRDGHPLRARRRAAVHDAVGRPHRRARRLHRRGGRARRRGPRRPRWTSCAPSRASWRRSSTRPPPTGCRPRTWPRRSCTTTRC